MRAGSRRGVLGSVGHGAGRDHVCSQVVTERYSLRMYARGSERTSEFRPVYGTRATRPPVRGVVPRAGVRRTRADTRRGLPSARMTRILIHGQTTRSSRCSAEDSLRVTCTTTERGASRRYYILLFRCVQLGASGVHCVHALLIDIVRREIRSVHVHGRAVDSNDDVTTARENETRSTRAGESREASLRADPGRSL